MKQHLLLDLNILPFRFRAFFDFNNLIFAHIIIAAIFIALACFYILTGFTPIHDAISWHGIYHYFYTSIEKGIFPFWNPYSQTGTPFYVYYQPFGLLEPSHFLFIFFQKVTGCTTLTTYLLNYLFYFFVFILGAYHSLRIITRSNSTSILFSLVLLFSCFPIFMRQNGALNGSFLIPLITYFLLLFFEEDRNIKKGFYFFIASYLFALTLNIYIPVMTIFYLLFFLILIFLFKIAKLQEIFKFVKSRNGLFWIAASVVVIILISLPVLTLYHDFHNNNEIFPSVRVLQKNENNLVRLYASDIKDNLFSEKYTGNLKVSTNLWNLLGLISEPLLLFTGAPSSEVFLYISFFPLLCMFIAIKQRNRYTYVFLTSAIVTLLVISNFKDKIVTQPSLFQKVIISIIPFLRTVEVLQNFGPIFLFSIVVLGAIGFKSILPNNKDKSIWNIPILAVFSKNLVLLFLIILFVEYKISFLEVANWLYKITNLSSGLITDHMVLAVILVLLLLLSYFLYKLLNKININKVHIIAIIVLLLDLIVFSMFHATHFSVPNIKYEKAIGNFYYNSLKKEDLLTKKQETSFINYRDIFSVPDIVSNDPVLFITFWGHEVYNLKKIAFPNVVRINLIKKNAPQWDHFYMTKYYYDYIANITLYRQLATSSIIAPILNFFPVKNAVFLDNKYEVVNKINQLSPRELGRVIFIEKNENEKSTYPDISYFFDSDHYLEYSQNEILTFISMLDRKIISPEPKYDINKSAENILIKNRKNKKSEYIFNGETYINTGVNIEKWQRFSASLQLYVPEAKYGHEIILGFNHTNRTIGVLDLGSHPRKGFVSLRWCVGEKALLVPIEVKKWHHIVVTADRESKKLQLFLNYKSVGENFSSNQLWGNDALITIGRHPSSDKGWFHGSVSDLKFYDSVLSLIGNEYVNVLGKEEELFKYKNDSNQRYPRNLDMKYEIIDYNTNKLSVNIEATEKGYFFFGDGYSKYWKAFLNGKEAKIYKTNINFKSVYVPEGKQKVDFIYDPVFFRYSLYAYFIGNFIALIAMLLPVYLNYDKQHIN